MHTYSLVKSQFREGKFAPLYLFFGEEKYLQEELLSSLIGSYLGSESDFGVEKVDGSSYALDELIDQISERGLFSSRRLLVIDSPPYLAPPRKTDKDDELPPADEPEAADSKTLETLKVYLENQVKPVPASVIVLLASRVDRRKKFYKLIDQKAVAVECIPLKGENLYHWIKLQAEKGGKSIERNAVERLMLAGEQNLHYMASEIEKYSTYLGEDEKLITAPVVDALFAGDLQGDVFKLADALAEKNFSRAENLLQLLLKRREKPLLIFFMLARHFRLLLQARCLLEQGLPAAQFASTLEVQPFVARKLRDQAAFYNLLSLEDAILIFQSIDLQIKTGRLDPEQALLLLLSRIDSLQNGARQINI